MIDKPFGSNFVSEVEDHHIDTAESTVEQLKENADDLFTLLGDLGVLLRNIKDDRPHPHADFIASIDEDDPPSSREIWRREVATAIFHAGEIAEGLHAYLRNLVVDLGGDPRTMD